MKSKLLTLFALTLLSPALHAAMVTVPGTSNPWLAGMPDGWITPYGDEAPAESPVLIAGLPITPGTVLTFSVSGAVKYDPGYPSDGPDGGDVTPYLVEHSENGMASLTAPANALVGVFLDDSRPDDSAAPPELDFSSEDSRQFRILSPLLKQVFFIGDGLTGTGSGLVQQFTVPPGATRLFLGTMDGFGYYNNEGSLSVEIHGQVMPSPLLSIRVSPIELCWDTVTNAWYQLQYCSNLTANVWVPFTTNWLRGDGAQVCTNDTGLPAPQQRFYRVAVTNAQPQP